MSSENEDLELTFDSSNIHAIEINSVMEEDIIQFEIARLSHFLYTESLDEYELSSLFVWCAVHSEIAAYSV